MTMTTADRAYAARTAITDRTGDGWMSSAARDMIRIAAFAGFDPAEVLRRVAATTDPNRTTNAASVERVMDEMQAEWDAAHPEQVPA